jgi:hypothetical protein
MENYPQGNSKYCGRTQGSNRFAGQENPSALEAASILELHAGSVTDRSKMLKRGKNNRIDTNKKGVKTRGRRKFTV